MTDTQCILFDCMETVVDIVEKPDVRLYAWWAYDGCGYESLWSSFDEFAKDYLWARNELEHSKHVYKEYALIDRFRCMVENREQDRKAANRIVDAICTNYWSNYKANCFVSDRVKSTLAYIGEKCRMGIVSNFMVDGGVEELLACHGIACYFDFILTSVRVGWRKPHRKIYNKALELVNAPADKILFVGDDYECDYEGPRNYGMRALLLDRERKYNQESSIQNLEDVMGWINL